MKPTLTFVNETVRTIPVTARVCGRASLERGAPPGLFSLLDCHDSFRIKYDSIDACWRNLFVTKAGTKLKANR